jgi:metal-responsive CopG/Arc/MetJ family transcriptional regulator
MAQLTVRLPDELDQALAAVAERLQRKRGEVVRIALRRFLEIDVDGEPAERVRSLLGSLESGVPDLAENHRRYILESLRRGA